MFDRITGLKNILWAIGIVLCLVALFVGFVFSAVTPYHGDADPRTPNLNTIKEEKGTVDVDSLTFVEPDGELHELRQTTDAGEDYIRSAVFLTDSIMIAMRDQSLTGGDVWSSESGSLPMGNIATWNILYSDGSKISPVDACMITKPSVLFLCIGSDGLARVEKADFISGYESLIRAILVASPETTVVCCSIPPVTENYSALDDLTSDLTNDSGFISGYTETDPTVPAWAKAASKPSYTANEVGALPTGTTLDNVADGTTRKLSNYATTGTVNTLNNTVTAHTANTTIHVTTAQTAAWDGKQDAISDLATIRSNAEAGAAKVSNVQADWNATTGLAAILNKPTIPSAPGTLTTTATTAQSTATNEALTGNISLHKVSKTGSYNDLTNKPTIPTVPAWATASTKPTYTASEVGALPTGTTLDNVADGTTRKLSDYATQANFTAHTASTTVHVSTTEKNTWNGKQDAISDLSTIRNNASSGASAYTGVTALSGATTAHTATTIANGTSSQMHLPTVSASDNDKILQVKNGAWSLVTPVSIYTGSGTPSQSLGNDGDIYLQTS